MRPNPVRDTLRAGGTCGYRKLHPAGGYAAIGYSHRRDVVLVDRRRADEETSYGNAGLIQREGVIP
jgi:hypothetical protein